MKLWEKNSAHYRAKRIVRQFLWVIVVLGFLVPLAVHNLRVSELRVHGSVGVIREHLLVLCL